MNTATLLRVTIAFAAAFLAGCASKSASPGGGGSSGGAGVGARSDFGVISKIDDPTTVAAVRTFYVAPNGQTAMASSFVAGAPLSQVFADRIATALVKKGLQQAPSDMADMTVTFSVQAPSASNANPSSSAQGLSYADQLLNEAQSLETKDNFLDNDRLDFRIRMTTPKSAQQPIWRGAIAGVMPPGEATRDRLLDTLAAVDRLLDEYPKVGR
jgi:hypothetical protein